MYERNQYATKMRLKVHREKVEIPQTPNSYWQLSHDGEPICRKLEATIKNIIHQNESVKMRRSFFSWLISVNTEPELYSLIRKIFNMIIMGNDGPFNEDISSSSTHRQLIREQNNIGWMQFFKGRMSRKFREIQHEYYEELREEMEEQEGKKLNMRYDGKWWTTNLIRRIVYYSLTQWQIRNNNVHDLINELENRERNKDEINNKIIEWYEKKEVAPTSMRYLFRVPLIDRCMKAMRSREAWLRTINLEIEDNGWNDNKME